MKAALQVDKRLGLRERFSTVLSLADSGEPFAKAACFDARDYAGHISNVKRKFPLKLSRKWGYAGTVWLVVIIAMLLPQEDLLGLGNKQAKKVVRDQQLKQAKVEVKKTTEAIKAAVKQLGDPELEKAAEQLTKIPGVSQPEKIKHQAIRKLGDMADRLKDKQQRAAQQGVKIMQKMLSQLRSMPGMQQQKLQLALAKGDFNQAKKYIRQMQKELNEGKMSKKDREKLAKEFKDLSRQLEELAQKNQEL